MKFYVIMCGYPYVFIYMFPANFITQPSRSRVKTGTDKRRNRLGVMLALVNHSVTVKQDNNSLVAILVFLSGQAVLWISSVSLSNFSASFNSPLSRRQLPNIPRATREEQS